jgi:hypothetical protein
MFEVVRNAGWFSAQRASGYGKAILLLMLLAFIPYYLVGVGLITPEGEVVGSDFLNFWSAGKAVLVGDPAAAYNEDFMREVQAGAVPGAPLYHYMYAPPFLIIFSVLALLPYEAAMLLWVGLTYFIYLVMAAKLIPVNGAIWPIAAFPAALVVAGHGQTSFVVFAVFAAGFFALPNRPFIGGLILGLLLMKPHLAVLLPVAMLAARNWSAVAGGALSVGSLIGAGLLLFGPETYRAYQISFDVGGQVLQGGVPYFSMVSIYAAIMLATGDYVLAITVQALLTCIAVVIVWMVWRREYDVYAKGSVLVLCALLATPYSYDYDLLLLMFPIAWLTREGIANGFRPWEKSLIALCWWLPLGARAIGKAAGLNLAPLVVAICLAVVLHKITRAHSTPRPPN